MKNYLGEQPELSGTELSQRCTTRFHPQWELLHQSLHLGRPALVLFMQSGSLMHWVNIVARDKDSGNWLIMETDGEMFEILGGDDELSNLMNCDNCAAQRFGFIERFNSVTCTANCAPKDNL